MTTESPFLSYFDSIENEEFHGQFTILNKEHLTCYTSTQEVGSGKLCYLTLLSDCVGSVGDV